MNFKEEPETFKKNNPAGFMDDYELKEFKTIDDGIMEIYLQLYNLMKRSWIIKPDDICIHFSIYEEGEMSIVKDLIVHYLMTNTAYVDSYQTTFDVTTNAGIWVSEDMVCSCIGTIIYLRNENSGGNPFTLRFIREVISSSVLDALNYVRQQNNERIVGEINADILEDLG